MTRIRCRITHFEGPSACLSVLFGLSRVSYLTYLERFELQSSPFGSFFSIKAQRNVTGSQVLSTDSGPSVGPPHLSSQSQPCLSQHLFSACIASILGMPLTALVSRHDILTVGT
jgi:hypothetical protein